jgi:hypothetical protein
VATLTNIQYSISVLSAVTKTAHLKVNVPNPHFTLRKKLRKAVIFTSKMSKDSIESSEDTKHFPFRFTLMAFFLSPQNPQIHYSLTQRASGFSCLLNFHFTSPTEQIASKQANTFTEQIIQVHSSASLCFGSFTQNKLCMTSERRV